jgi:hypothetical protein
MLGQVQHVSWSIMRQSLVLLSATMPHLQINRAIDTLPDLTDYYNTVARPRIEAQTRARDEAIRHSQAPPVAAIV